MHKNNEAIVIPIILQPCLWEISNFAKQKLQALPKGAIPITTYANQEEAWTGVAKEILTIANKINNKSKAKKSPKENPNNKKNENQKKLIIKFLCTYSKWYFSPLRVSKWGGRQPNFEELSEMNSSEVTVILKELLDERKVTTKISQRGNPIYKIVKRNC